MRLKQTQRTFIAFLKKERYLRAYIRRFFRDDSIVDDICQETVMRALEAERLKKIDSPDAFLFGVARNVVRKELDARSRSLIQFVEDFSPDQFDSPAPEVERVLDDRQKMLMFTESVLKLPRQCQRVFVMKKVYGYSHKEISATLGISISTIEKHVSTAMKRCLDDLNDDVLSGLTVVSTTAAQRPGKVR